MFVYVCVCGVGVCISLEPEFMERVSLCVLCVIGPCRYGTVCVCVCVCWCSRLLCVVLSLCVCVCVCVCVCGGGSVLPSIVKSVCGAIQERVIIYHRQADG